MKSVKCDKCGGYIGKSYMPCICDLKGLDIDGDIVVDMVNHPKHYQAKNGLEAIDVIEAFTDGLNGIEATDTGNIIKYALRWKDKNGVEDIKKIVWYANHLIEHLEK